MPLPSPTERHRIETAVHAAVEAVLGPTPAPMVGSAGGNTVAGLSGRCFFHASAAARVASAVLGKPYEAVAGSLIVENGTPGGGFGYKAPGHGGMAGEFHMWCEHDNPGGQVEVFDPTARHYASIAAELGMQPPSKPTPIPLWDYWPTFRNVHGVIVLADEPLTAKKAAAASGIQKPDIDKTVAHAMAALSSATTTTPSPAPSVPRKNP